MSKLQHILIAGLTSASVLAGCGVSPTGRALSPFATRGANRAKIYSVNGEAHLVVKRRGLSTQAVLSVAGVHTLGAVEGIDVQEAAVRLDQVDQAIAALRQDPTVEYAEPAYEMDATGYTVPTFRGLGFNVGDPLFAQQYAPQITHATDAWALTRGAGVTVAVVDTGVDLTHPEFQGRLTQGYNATNRTSNAKDDNGHGTHCAGIIAAGLNGVGTVGMAPEAKIMPVKVLAADGSGSDAQVAAGITWAANHGANVISMSLGGPGQSKVLADAVAYALKKGVPVIAAMGNDGTGDQSFPAAYPGVIAVGATNAQDQIADFSQYGNWISVTAPGVQILSTFPTYQVHLNAYGFPQNYASLDGTSMATPCVAGLAALVKSRYGLNLTPDQIKSRIESTADQVSGSPFDPHFGHGRINAATALQ